MVQSMLDLEHMFNSKFNYPWTFLNDVPFDEEFKRKTRAATNAEITYGTIFLFFFFVLFFFFFFFFSFFDFQLISYTIC